MAYFRSGLFASLALLIFLVDAQSVPSSRLPSRSPLASQTLPVYSLGTINGSTRADGSSRASGATCSDNFGWFPCSCLAVSVSHYGFIQSDPVRVQTYASNEVLTYAGRSWTESVLTGTRPPDECCGACEIAADGVRVLFWPVDDYNKTAQNISHAAATMPHTTVSNGFTFTSPSVYVAYENVLAYTACDRFNAPNKGESYNTTVAYNPEGLSTSRCYMGVWETLNYTEMQYPPRNTLLTDCFIPGGKWAQLSENPNEQTISPKLSFPSDLSLLVPSWKSCTYSIWGVWDPPHTLGQATAMAPASTPSPVAAPAAHISPANAPATPTPSPKDPQGSTPNPAASPVDPGDRGSNPDPNQPDPQQSSPQNAEAPKAKTGNPSSNNPPTKDRPGNNDPPSDAPSNYDPSSNGPPKASPTNKEPLNNGPKSSDSPNSHNSPSNDPPSNNGPPSNDPPSNNNHPANSPSKNDPTSIGATPVPDALPQSHRVQNQSPSSAAPNGADPAQSPGIGAQIASALGYVPDSPASPVNNPVMANSEPKVIEEANGSPSPFMVGGIPVQTVSNGAMLVAGQTIPQGSQATVSGVVVSVGNSDVAIDGTNHAFSPLASETPMPLVVGGNTAQRAPNGGLVVASHTLAPGAQATVAGVVVSVGSSNAILDGTTHNLAPIAPTPVSVIVNGVTTALQPAEAGASQAPVINVGGQDITFNQASPSVGVADQRLTPGIPGQGSPYIIAGQTIIPGGAAVTVSSIPISLPTAQYFAGNLPAIAIDAPATQAGGQTPVTIGNQVFTPNPSAFAIAGSTLSAGAPGVTLAGTLISLQPLGGGLVIGSSTLALAAPTASPESPTPVTLGGQVFTPNPTAFAIAGTTLTAGAPGVTVAGTVISLQPSGAGLVVGSNTLALATASPTFRTSAITLGNQVFTPNPTGFSIAGTTISAGGPGITVAGAVGPGVTVDGTVVSLRPLSGGGGLLVGSSTLALASPTPTPDPVTIGSQIFTPNPTGFSIAGTTISAGGPGVTVDGTVVSLASDGSALVVGSSTLALPSPPPIPGPITIGSQVFTPNPTGFSIDGTTISAGGQGVTIDGTVVSLDSLSGGAILVVGSSTIQLVRTTAGAGTRASVAIVTSSPGTGDTNTTSTAEVASPTSSSSSGATTGSSPPTQLTSSNSQKLSLRGQVGFISIALLAVSLLVVT